MNPANKRGALPLLKMLMEHGLVRSSDWPKSQENERLALIQSGIVRVAVPGGKRSPHLMLSSPEKLKARISKFEGEAPADDLPERAKNLHQSGFSKNGAKLPYVLINILPGKTPWKSAGNELFLGNAEGVYSGLICKDGEESPEPEGDVVLIENRESWVGMRKRLPENLAGASLIHYEGWLSKRFLQILARWTRAKIWIAPDYDIVGYHNFIRLSEVRQDVRLLLPKLTNEQILQWGSEDLWEKQRSYLYTVAQWANAQSSAEATFFSRLAGLGMGIEQEFLDAIAHLEWDPETLIETTRPPGNLEQHSDPEGGGP